MSQVNETDSLSGRHQVVIADDHAIVRNALKEIVNEIDHTSVVSEAENGFEAITLAKSIKPELLMLDSVMPLARGMDVYSEVRRWSPQTKVIVVTGFTSVGHLADWIEVGIDGLFLKSCPPQEIKTGTELVLNGSVYRSNAVTAILEEVTERPTLTLRERQVLHLIARGQSNKEIADQLSISSKTVDNHRTRMMSKIGVHSIVQLLAYALKEGLLDQGAQL